MAIFNEILSGRFNRSLQKLFAIKGSAPVRQLAGEVMPTHSLASGVETRYLEAWQRYGLGISIPGVAGNLSAARIRNPAASNLIIVLEKFTIGPSLADTMQITQGNILTDLATISVGERLDPRGLLNPTSITSSQSSLGTTFFGNNLAFIPILSGDSKDVIVTEDQELLLLPGDGIQVTTIGANQALRISWTWRERLLEESERT